MSATPDPAGLDGIDGAGVDRLLAQAEELERLGRPELAVLEYGELMYAQLGGVEPLVRRAVLLRELGRFAEAQADFELAARMEPTNAWPLLRLAQMLHAKGALWPAAAVVQAALERQPRTEEIRVNAAQIFTALEWLDLAWTVVRPLPEGLGGWWGEMRRDGREAYRLHRARALVILRRRRDLGQDAEGLEELAQLLFRLGRLRLARKLCERLMRRSPDDFAAFELCAGIVAREGGPAAAHGFLRAIAFLHAETPRYRNTLSRVAGQMEQSGTPAFPEREWPWRPS